MEDASVVALVRANSDARIGGDSIENASEKPICNINNNNNNNKLGCANGNLVQFCGPAEQAAILEGVEILVVASSASSHAAPPVPRKEDEQITSAVMKVLQGYQWSLVPTPTKFVIY